MDCCGSSKPNETDKDTKQEQTGTVKNPAEKEQKHSAGCGGGTKDMLLHIVLMVIVFLAISYFTRA